MRKRNADKGCCSPLSASEEVVEPRRIPRIRCANPRPLRPLTRPCALRWQRRLRALLSSAPRSEFDSPRMAKRNADAAASAIVRMK